MTKRIIICVLAICVAASACKKEDEKEKSGPTEATEKTTPSPESGLTFGAHGELTEKYAALFAQEWFEAYQNSDWSSLESVFAVDAEIIIDRGVLVDRISPQVWKSQLGAHKNQRTPDWGLEKIDFAKFDGGAFFRVNVADKTREHPLPPQEWEFVIRNTTGEPKLALLFQREARPRATGAPDRQLGSLVLADGLVLQPHAETDAERGYRTLVDQGGLSELWVDSSKLPREWQELENQPFEVFDATGESCQTKVTGFRYYATIDPPAWLETAWEGKLDDKMTRRAAGEAAWTMAGKSGRALVARFNPDDLEGCDNPIWARRMTSQPFATFEETASAELTAEAMNHFEELESVAAIQRDYVSQGKTGAWFELGEAPVITAFEDGKRTFVTISASAGTTCNDFVASTFAVWEVSGQNWSLLTPAKESFGDFRPIFAADIDNDGSPEFYGDGAVVRRAAGAYRLVEDVRPVSFEGGC